MPNTKATKFNNIEFKLEWQSPVAFHTDVLLVANVDTLRDKLPSDFGEKIAQLAVGESYSKTLAAKELLGEGFSTDKVISFETKYFDTSFKEQHSPPILYRFYPTAIAWQGLNTVISDYTPFRLISINDDHMVADCNHPLAKYYLTLTANKVSESDASLWKESTRRDLCKLITSSGPGMQAPFEFGEAIFFDHYPFQLKDKKTDKTQHFEPSLSEQLAKLHSKLLTKHSKVLDLMSHRDSYLEEGYKTGLMTGLGKNEKDLNANKRLDTYQVQDLTRIITLPFETNSFDDAICSFSIEQLTDPLAVMREVARVVKSEGKFIITFSEGQYSSNPIALWAQLHPFERLQLVLEYFRQSSLFDELNTQSIRSLLSNKREKGTASQIYTVWGSVK